MTPSPPVIIRAYREADLQPLRAIFNEVIAAGDAFVYDVPFTTDQMKALVETLRRGKTLTVGLAEPAVTEPFTLAGSGAALENILDCAKR